MPSSVRLRAPAKVNLGLRVLGRLDEGTHSVETILQAVDLFDDLELALGEEGIRISIHGQRREGVPEGEDNLAVRAAAALLRATRSSAGVEIRLTKRIPHAAGLGGGSSDAAAVLHGLALLLEEPPSTETLNEVAGSLGSDVPFFLRGGTAFGYHRGDRLLALPPLPPLPALLVVPDIQVSTFWAYNTWDLEHKREPPGGAMGPALRFDLDLDDLARCRNDFEPLVFAKFPEVESILRALAEGDPIVARLSGTGAACFSLYREASHRDAESERLRDVFRNHSDCGIFRVRLFSGGVEVVG